MILRLSESKNYLRAEAQHVKLLDMSKKIPVESVIRPILFIKNKLEKIVDPFLMKKFGITESQFKILTPIYFHGHISQKELADFWNISEAAINRQIAIMIKKGFVIKKASKKDLRKTEIHLSPKIQAMIHTIYPQLDFFLESIFKDFSHNERQEIIPLLEKIITILGIDYPPVVPLHKK